MNTEKENVANIQKFKLQFKVTGLLFEFVHLQLFNGNDELISKGYGKISEELPKGLYQLYIFSNVKFEQKLIRLDKDYHGNWENTAAYSSLTNSSLKSSHEYYTETSKHWAEYPTVNQSNTTNENSSLFLFFRYPDKEKVKTQQKVASSMGWRFSILNSYKEVIYRLKGDVIKEDREMGWMTFHACVEPGIYYLVYNGPKKKEIPLYVFPLWQTQFFLMFQKTPIFQTIRIQILKEGRFLDESRNNDLELDIILQNMQNGIYHVPESSIRDTAEEKWENPILAIVVCYAYLLSFETKHDNLFQMIIGNLQNRILNNQNAPDILAIQLLAALHFKQPIPILSLDEPCMLKAGMKVFLEQEVKNPNKISISQNCREIINNLQDDTIWTSYHPISEKTDYTLPQFGNISFEDNINERGIKGYRSYFVDKIKTNQNKNRSFERNDLPNDWLTQSLIQQLSSSINPNQSPKDLAMQYQVSVDQINNRLKNINKALDYQNQNESSTDEMYSSPKSINLENLDSIGSEKLHIQITNFMDKME